MAARRVGSALLSACAAAGLVAAAGGSGAAQPAAPPNVLLITLDTVRADHLVRVQRSLEEGNAALEDLRAGRVLRSVLIP